MLKNKLITIYHLFIIILLIINISLINSQNSSKNEKVNLKEKMQNIMKEFSLEWQTKMQDYKPEYTYYIPIRYKDHEVFYENITSIPTIFKGAFFISDESLDIIEFYIKDSYDKVIYKATGHYNIFEIPIDKPDKYSITFRNNFAKDKVVITFTMNTGQNDIINSNDLSITEKKLDNLEAVIKKFNMEFKLSRDIHNRRYQSKL